MPAAEALFFLCRQTGREAGIEQSADKQGPKGGATKILFCDDDGVDPHFCMLAAIGGINDR